MGPFMGGEIISTTLFFKTTKSKEMILICYGGRFGVSNKKDIFLLTIKKGELTLYFGKQKYLTTAEDYNLNDGQWHHIAISMPSKSCLNSEVEMILNGKAVETVWSGTDDYVFFTTSGKVSLGGWGYSNPKFDAKYPTMNNFVGMMDGFRVYGGKAMTNAMLRQSIMRKFEDNSAVCNGPVEYRKSLNLKSSKICFRKCKRRPDCWGYELLDKTGKKFNCFHYYGRRPEVGESSDSGNKCNPVLR